MTNEATKRGSTSVKDESLAIAELAQKIALPNMAGVILFCSSQYNLQNIAVAITQNFSCPVIACTTAGEIAEDYQQHSIVAVSFSADYFRLYPQLISQVSEQPMRDIESVVNNIQSLTPFTDQQPVNRVGFLLIDGLSMSEETVAAALSNGLPHIPLVGGSAGDNLEFSNTFVFINGEFINDAAVYTLIETTLDIEIFKVQHFTPSEQDLVVTVADPQRRIVYEIDGEPAAGAYAALLGITAEKLEPEVFSFHPVMLQIGDEWYVRAIQKAQDDGSLVFYCAIENGLPLTIAEGVHMIKNLQCLVDKILHTFSDINLTLGCDCILRRLEIDKMNYKSQIIQTLKPLTFLGFSTYGEQYNAIHVNQTLTAIVFGKKKE
ncbi:hypothetical protein MNBD_GAMMA16-396 [hydrothermal vent metagenome]|uniref:FIST domain containing protein n=1 Tax=hydrothermal vent metagenome TaxID=652676 RepID=A0A3B0Z4W6_9ZZZZ